MLKQSYNPQDNSAPEESAGQMRVKKEEFARAIAALEARRQSEAQAQEGTVVIGDVLQQLQIDLPADEVLREIESLHAGQPREKAARRPWWTADRKSAAVLITGIFLVPVAAVGMAALMLNPLRTPKPAIPSGTFSGPPPGSSPLWMMPPPNLPPGVTGEMMDEGGFNASSVLKPLSSIPDNQPVHCTTAGFNQLLSLSDRDAFPGMYNHPSPHITLDPAALARSSQLFDVRPNLRKPWILVKHDGKLYLRGWVAGTFTQAQVAGQVVKLHSSPRSFGLGAQPRQITLPIRFFHYSSQNNESGPTKIIISNVTLDEHAWEKW